MSSLPLHEFHTTQHAAFAEVNGAEAVAGYGDVRREYEALTTRAGVIDLSFRSRVCLTGADRARFLHGQVTNEIKRLKTGEGCYAAITTAKGKMESDLNVFVLQDELLLDFEPGLTEKISQRLEKFIVSDDVQVVDVAPHYGLLSVQGPQADAAVRALEIFPQLPAGAYQSIKVSEAMLGDLYLMNHRRLAPLDGTAQSSATAGYDLFVPLHSLAAVADKLAAGAKAAGGRLCGWEAYELARIEAGVPRFGADMDETNLPPECGIEARAISYNKGCYIGQEVINRIHSIGHVNKQLRRLALADGMTPLPVNGDKLFLGEKEAGYVTSAASAPNTGKNFALGYVRREALAGGAGLFVRTTAVDSPVSIIEAVNSK